MKTPYIQFIGQSFLRFRLRLIPLLLACIALTPQARATCQDACLTNNNTVQGDEALVNLTTGTRNTAIGTIALIFNTTGSDNTATGYGALEYNTTGYNNIATGLYALSGNQGHDNTADGALALYANSTGDNNVANGSQALFTNTTGSNNTAIGDNALFRNETGAGNIALGSRAGFNLTTGSENIAIGNPGRDGESNTIRVGKVGTHTATYVAGIHGVTVAGGITVIVNANGRLGTLASSERFKEAVKPMDKASEAILALKPVTFRYKHNLDPQGIPQFGLVAEQVETVNPNLVARDEHGKPYTVRYEAVNAMLLNEFLKEHRKVEQLEKQVEVLAAGLQKVSAQLEVSKLTPQVADTN